MQNMEMKRFARILSKLKASLRRVVKQLLIVSKHGNQQWQKYLSAVPIKMKWTKAGFLYTIPFDWSIIFATISSLDLNCGLINSG